MGQTSSQLVDGAQMSQSAAMAPPPVPRPKRKRKRQSGGSIAGASTTPSVQLAHDLETEVQASATKKPAQKKQKTRASGDVPTAPEPPRPAKKRKSQEAVPSSPEAVSEEPSQRKENFDPNEPRGIWEEEKYSRAAKRAAALFTQLQKEQEALKKVEQLQDVPRLKDAQSYVRNMELELAKAQWKDMVAFEMLTLGREAFDKGVYEEGAYQEEAEAIARESGLADDAPDEGSIEWSDWADAESEASSMAQFQLLPVPDARERREGSERRRQRNWEAHQKHTPSPEERRVSAKRKQLKAESHHSEEPEGMEAEHRTNTPSEVMGWSWEDPNVEIEAESNDDEGEEEQPEASMDADGGADGGGESNVEIEDVYEPVEPDTFAEVTTRVASWLDGQEHDPETASEEEDESRIDSPVRKRPRSSRAASTRKRADGVQAKPRNSTAGQENLPTWLDPAPTTTSGPYTNEERTICDRIFDEVMREQNLSENELKTLLKDWSSAGIFKEAVNAALPNRNRQSIRKFCQRRYHNLDRGPWTEEQDDALRKAYAAWPDQWTKIETLTNRTAADCKDRWRGHLQLKDKATGPWSVEEEKALMKVVEECIDKIKKERRNDKELLEDRAQLEALIGWEAVVDKLGKTRGARKCREKYAKLKTRPPATDSSINSPVSEASGEGEAQSDTRSRNDSLTKSRRESNGSGEINLKPVYWRKYKQQHIQKSLEDFELGDYYDVFVEIHTAFPDHNANFRDETTLWSIVGQKNISRFSVVHNGTAIRKAALQTAMELWTKDSKKVQRRLDGVSTIPAKALVLAQWIERKAADTDALPRTYRPDLLGKTVEEILKCKRENKRGYQKKKATDLSKDRVSDSEGDEEEDEDEDGEEEAEEHGNDNEEVEAQQSDDEDVEMEGDNDGEVEVQESHDEDAEERESDDEEESEQQEVDREVVKQQQSDDEEVETPESDDGSVGKQESDDEDTDEDADSGPQVKTETNSEMGDMDNAEPLTPESQADSESEASSAVDDESESSESESTGSSQPPSQPPSQTAYVMIPRYAVGSNADEGVPLAAAQKIDCETSSSNGVLAEKPEQDSDDTDDDDDGSIYEDDGVAEVPEIPESDDERITRSSARQNKTDVNVVTHTKAPTYPRPRGKNADLMEFLSVSSLDMFPDTPDRTPEPNLSSDDFLRRCEEVGRRQHASFQAINSPHGMML